jgi:hypothetical protein
MPENIADNFMQLRPGAYTPAFFHMRAKVAIARARRVRPLQANSITLQFRKGIAITCASG